MPVVRRVPESDFERYRRLVQYAFHPEDGPQSELSVPDRIADRYGCYEGDRLLSTGALYELDVRLRDVWTTISGIAAVSSPPEHRRSGNVETLLAGLLAESRERGLGLAALWPFEHAFYRQFGWAISDRYTIYELPPAQLAAAGTTARGTYERVGPDDWQRLERVQRAHGEGTTLSMGRSEQWWRSRTFGDDPPWAYAWHDGDELRGYVTYTFESANDSDVLGVDDFSAADRDARRHLLGLLGTHDSQVEAVELTLAEEGALLDAVADPNAVSCSVHAGPMIRVTDPALALESCPYPDDIAARVVFEVTDPIGDDRRFELTVENGTGTCEPTRADPDATVDVGTLAQLLIGYRPVADVREHGLDCGEKTAATLGALFPQENVQLREFF
ncbi:GNAT family N-acetyltransferase [Halapricum hydrolyticum]|uniref:GNAT family N-acetyltransferase n=1 Tax=Halapricum hydrolyticum TaxID=2979991 RepID=A0AAE3I8Y0_9EURY|nr:GNAT family N-acetyltransferase [Halapricum hydrolyticum]MCU4716833.1 GNAT family N-acetyltransferase [Halapricum hydrolyticum]MCU4725562.1 GNAT family N-acetyltransferase [Halapricum hydrolyticum]